MTNLDEWIPRQVVSAYQRRWPVEQINRELKTDLGLGEHQVSTEEGRIEKSFGIAVLAVSVADPYLPSGDSPWDVVEYCATAACVSFTPHHESSGA